LLAPITDFFDVCALVRSLPFSLLLLLLLLLLVLLLLLLLLPSSHAFLRSRDSL